MPILELLDTCKQSEGPMADMRRKAMNDLKSNADGADGADDGISDTDARLRAVGFSMETLAKPIKLISRSVLFELGRFPRYDEEFPHTLLSHKVICSCVAVSHRWTDEENSRSDVDVAWLQRNWSNFNLEGTDEVLFYYDFCSLIQKHGDYTLNREELLTFRAGLELVDHVFFSERSIIIPSKGYLFRYWCFVEFFIASYNRSSLSGFPFVEPLPTDLKIFDMAIDWIHKMIVRPSQPELQMEGLFLSWKITELLCLGTETKKNLFGAIMGMKEMNRDTRRVVLREFLRERQVVVNMIRSRLRQCSLTFEEDKTYLNTILANYLEKAPPSEVDLNLAYEDWDQEAASTSFTDTVEKAKDQAEKLAGTKRKSEDKE